MRLLFCLAQFEQGAKKKKNRKYEKCEVCAAGSACLVPCALGVRGETARTHHLGELPVVAVAPQVLCPRKGAEEKGEFLC